MTRAAIKRRSPALIEAIKKFNGYCQRLDEMKPEDSSIPTPHQLPTKLADLRNSPNLLEDVWIYPSEGQAPRWLASSDVRSGIRAMLKLDRCNEERTRLGIEADNLCRWLQAEYRATKNALMSPSSECFSL